MYYQKNYGTRFGGGYHNYSMPNRTTSHQNKMSEQSSCDNAKDFPIAMAYVPWQTWGNLYEPCEALSQGTIFRELNLKFCG